MGDPIQIAIAGIGAVSEKHAAAVSELDDALIVAGSCRTAEKGQAFAAEHDAAWFDDTEDMLDTVQPDVLIVCTPSGAHLEPTLAALNRDIHVLCEKPLEITTDRIDQMIAAAASSPAMLGGIFQQRFNDVMNEIESVARAGRFGDLATANAYVPWWRDDTYYVDAWQGTQALDGGGALMNQSIHAIDVVQWLAGTAIGSDSDQNPVDEVMAYTDRRCHDANLMSVEDTAVACLRFQDGTLGQLLGSTGMYPGTRRRLQIGGRNGTVEVLEDELITWAFRDESPKDESIRTQYGEGESASGAADPMAISHELHRRNIATFLECLTADAPNPVSAREARKAVAIIEAIYASAARGEPVSVD